MRRRAVLFQLAVAFALLTALAVGLTWQRAAAAGEDLARANELIVPATRDIRLDEPGRYELVLLAQVPAQGEEDKPRVEEVRRLVPALTTTTGESLAWTETEGLGSIDDKDKGMLVTLGSFEVPVAGAYRLRLSYDERGGPRAKVLFGKEVRARAEAAARWAFAILLAVFLGGCLTAASVLMGIVFGVQVDEQRPD